MLTSKYYGQQDGSTVPDVVLTGNPGTDQITLTNAGYLGGRVMALKLSATAGRGTVVVPCDTSVVGQIPFGYLLNGPGEFAGSIGPSGSGKAPITRAFGQFFVDSQAYNPTPTLAYAVGAYLYCGEGGTAGLITSDVPTGSGAHTAPIAVCTQVPSASVPYLGVASLI
jgi:hypothetical protein